MDTTWPTIESIELVRSVTQAILAATDPSQAVARWAESLPVGDAPISLLAVGKAAIPMATSALNALGDRVARSLVYSTEHPSAPSLDSRCTVLIGDHPLATDRNVAGARQVVEFLADPSAADHHLIVLLSGGGSALLTLPAPGLPLDELTHLAATLMRRGCPIEELNCVRKHCEQLKGGRLAGTSSAKRTTVCVLSDVIGDPLTTIASGPFAPDPTTFADALDVLTQYDALDLSEAITDFVRAGAAGDHAETPKPGDPVFDRVTHNVILNNADAVLAARDAIRSPDHIPAILSVHTGTAQNAAKRLAEALGQHNAVVLGGEPVVAGVPEGSLGGPIQEAVLAAALELESDLFDWLVMGLATDGRDGPTDAAGAAIDRTMLRRARDRGLPLEDAIHSHNTHPLISDMNALIRTGPTGTNVNDVLIAIRR